MFQVLGAIGGISMIVAAVLALVFAFIWLILTR